MNSEKNGDPENYFAEVEQAAFSSGNLVPGIAASPDKMLQSRLFSYHDTHIGIPKDNVETKEKKNDD